MATTRTFVALALPAEVRAALADLTRDLPRPPRGLRWGSLAQAHLTLSFLGDLDDTDLQATRGAARAVAAGATPFVAALAGLGAFPRPERARVAWVGWGEGSDAVVALQAVLLAALGRPSDARRPFAPHVTIARAREPVDARRWLGAAPSWTGPPWRVDGLDVMASELAPGGAIHRRLERCPFGGARTD
jgi:RNA 2',3'-cyclic 3'-phosphodiesterase